MQQPLLTGKAFLFQCAQRTENAIATPVAWYFMHQWLQDYVYRIDIGWWVFALGGFGTIIIALVTVSFKAIKAAVANPVKSLRAE